MSASPEGPYESIGQPSAESQETAPQLAVLDRFTAYLAADQQSLADLCAEGQPQTSLVMHDFFVHDVTLANQKRQALGYRPIALLQGLLVTNNIKWIGELRNSAPAALPGIRDLYLPTLERSSHRYPQINVARMLSQQMEGIESPGVAYTQDLLTAYGKSVAELKH